MPFLKAPHPDLLQWDDFACDAAAAAQILYMAGRLQYPFDTARFDLRLNRQPGRPLFSAEGVRLIAQVLPVMVFRFSPDSTRSLLNPKVVKRSLKDLGYSNFAIARYLKSSYYKLNQQRVRDFLRLEQELGNRWHEHICSDSRRYVGHFLQHGGIVVTGRVVASVSLGHTVLLIPRRSRGETNVTLYDPASGLEQTSLNHLIASNELELEQSGFMAYLLR